MNDTAPQAASGKVLLHFTMSLDGFVAGPAAHRSACAGSTTNPLPRSTFVTARRRL